MIWVRLKGDSFKTKAASSHHFRIDDCSHQCYQHDFQYDLLPVVVELKRHARHSCALCKIIVLAPAPHSVPRFWSVGSLL